MHRLGLGSLWWQPHLHGLSVSSGALIFIASGNSWVPNRASLLNQRRSRLRGCAGVLFRDICQMGSLAGAAYLLHDNAGVLRRAQWEQKSHVEHKRKSLLD